MKLWSKLLFIAGIWGGLLSTWGADAPEFEVTAAIHAIEQAPDPSAVVAAYANGIAIDRNNPKVHDAYVRRMLDLGLPELGYRQARTLTTLQSSNGVAWGVVAYVDARRGDMPSAVSAINLAGQFAPGHPFVQRTAGEMLAWYDSQAEATQLAENAKIGLGKIRTLLEKSPAFTTAYNDAKKAYQADSTRGEPAPPGETPAPTVPQRPSLVETNVPGAYITPSPSPAYPGYYSYYYPDNYSYFPDPGPRWIDPTPWGWWQPIGYFSGLHFYPYTSIVLFHRYPHFRHRHHDRDGKGPFGRRHSWDYLSSRRSWDSLRSGPGDNGGRWHGDRNGRGGFYGRSAEPNPAIVQNGAQPQPSWNSLGHGVARSWSPRPNVISRGGVRPAPSTQPSWSALTSPNGSSLNNSRGMVARRDQPIAPRSAPPSWSMLGQGSAGTITRSSPSFVPQGPRPSAPPSWSSLGRGSARPSYQPSPAPRSSPGPSRGGGASWSSLGSGSGRRR